MDRIGRPSISLRAPCLTTLLMVQPCLVRELFGNQEAGERGLLVRTLAFVAAGGLVEDDGNLREPDRQALDEWGALVRCLLRLRHDRTEPLAVIAEAAAAAVLREFYNEAIRLRQGPLASVAGDLSRWRENACRVALALHVAEDPEGVTLTAATAERAVRLTRWAGCSTVRLLASGQEAPVKEAEAIRATLAHAGARGLTCTDLTRGSGNHLTGRKLDEALALLARLGLAHEVEEATGGRPANRWFAGAKKAN